MADIDLATILADGEYLKRSGDALVGDIPAAGGSPEDAVDAVAAALVEGAGIDIAYDDTANTITVAATSSGGSTILDGTGPPDPTTGAAGDYYEDKTAGILYGPKTASGWGTQQRITVAGSQSTTSFDEVGVRVRFARHGRVVGARYQRHSGTDLTVTIKAWKDATTAKIAEIADTQAAVTGPFTVTFPTPILVAADETWTFTAAATGNNTRNAAMQTVTNTTDVVFIEFRQNSTLNTYPDNVAGNAYYVEPIYEPNDAWPETVRQVAVARTVSDPKLAAIAGLTSATDTVAYFTGSGTAALTTVTSTARGLLDDTSVANMRTTLGVPATTEVAATAETVEAVAGTTYTVITADAGKLKSLTGTATITLPSAGPTAGQRVDFVCVGGAATFTLGGGATWHVNPTPSAVARAVGSFVTAVKMGATTWALVGDLA